MSDSIAARIPAAAASITAWVRSDHGQRMLRGVAITASIAIVGILVEAIRQVGWQQVVDVLPRNPLFWIFLALSYLSLPFYNWIINRRWWPLSWRAIAVFQRVRVMNESLFSYSGDTYFLMWITRSQRGAEATTALPEHRRRHPGATPFSAVKDSAIVSGLVGNGFTLAMLMLAIVMGGQALIDTIDPRTLLLAIQVFGLLILVNLGIVLFRGRLLSLSSFELSRLLVLHLLRVGFGHVFIILSWAVALPQVPLRMWILMGAIRLVIGRIPVPNKELLFGALAATLAGSASEDVAALMAVQGPLHLVCHAIFFAAAAAIESRGGMIRNQDTSSRA